MVAHTVSRIPTHHSEEACDMMTFCRLGARQRRAWMRATATLSCTRCAHSLVWKPRAPCARANAHTHTDPRSYTQKNRPFFVAGNTTLDTRVQFLSCWDEGSEARPHKKRIEPTRGTGQRLKGAVLQPSRIATVARECTVYAAAASRLHWSCRCKRLARTAGREPVVS